MRLFILILHIYNADMKMIWRDAVGDLRTVAIALLIAVLLFVGFVTWITFDSSVPNFGLELGYYGQFNRAVHAIEDMPRYTLIDYGLHKDITLEDFTLTVRLPDGQEATIWFYDETPAMKERSRKRLKKIIEQKIAESLAENGPEEES